MLEPLNTFYTTTDASRVLGVDPLTVAKWVDKGLLKGHKTAGGHRRIQHEDLRAFLIRQKMPLPPEFAKPAGKQRLLIVDDYENMLRSLKRAFKRDGDEVEVMTTTSGVEALLLLSTFRPDAMLIDLLMPNLDGYEVLRRVRAHDEFSTVKLIAMTGDAHAEACAEALKAGALACLDKPFQPEDVLKLIREPGITASAG